MALFNVRLKALRAFTLAELLMAVLVISIIMVALAPVITKRVSENLGINTSTESKGQQTYLSPGDYEFEVPEGINVLHIRAAGAGGAGGPATFIRGRKDIYNESSTAKVWIVPLGVTSIEFEIIGAGGAGGSSIGYATGNTCETGGVELMRAAESEANLCLRTYPENATYCTVQEIPHYDPYPTSSACWRDNNSGLYYQQASSNCNNSGYHNLTYAEGQRLVSMYPSSNSLQYIFTNNGSISYVSGCAIGLRYPDMYPNQICGLGTAWAGSYGIGVESGRLQFLSDSGVNARLKFCTKELIDYAHYSGAGGCSGAILRKTMDVIPGDKIVINTGSPAGILRYDSNNNFVEGYAVNKALDGNSGTSTSHGGAKDNNTTASGTTPSGTCRQCSSADCTRNYSNITCTQPSYSGTAGTSSAGGNGGIISPGTSTGAAQGGYKYIDSTRTGTQRYTSLELSKANGSNATQVGAGGGGAYGALWAGSTTISGGAGGPARITLTYDIAIPGGGGGGGAVVDGKAPDGKPYEILYKTTPGKKLYIHVGAGGTATAGTSTKGEGTVISDNPISSDTVAGGSHTGVTFNGGEVGAKVSNTSTYLTTNPVFRKGFAQNEGGAVYAWGNEASDPKGGAGGYLVYSGTSPARFKPSHSKNPADFKGADGTAVYQSLELGQYTRSGYRLYGLDGGFGSKCGGQLKSASEHASYTINATRACGGGIIQPTDDAASGSNYVVFCSTWDNYSNGVDGASFLESDVNSYNPSCHGGMGGGGAGARYTNAKAGRGSDGYLIIRWDSAENEF